MTDWPEYESHKVVQAAKIVGVERNHAGGAIVQKIWVRPAGEEFDGAGPTIIEAIRIAQQHEREVHAKRAAAVAAG